MIPDPRHLPLWCGTDVIGTSRAGCKERHLAPPICFEVTDQESRSELHFALSHRTWTLQRPKKKQPWICHLRSNEDKIMACQRRKMSLLGCVTCRARRIKCDVRTMCHCNDVRHSEQETGDASSMLAVLEVSIHLWRLRSQTSVGILPLRRGHRSRGIA